VRLAIRERWSKRELERQFKTALFERAVLSPPKVSPLVTQTYSEALSVFRDAYNVEFLGLPSVHAEADLHRGLLDKLKDFLIELGRDFCFVGSEYPLQVGDRDFALDLLFFHRGLNCLVAIELKVAALSRSIWASSTSISKRLTGMFVKLTSSRPSVCCSARARMMKWWSSRSAAAYPRP
jgi:predicted nuclease of restriction endonuclease-like (RecB) superfamily